MSTLVLYNPARVYKDLNDKAIPMEAYEMLLERLPEICGRYVSLLSGCILLAFCQNQNPASPHTKQYASRP